MLIKEKPTKGNTNSVSPHKFAKTLLQNIFLGWLGIDLFCTGNTALGVLNLLLLFTGFGTLLFSFVRFVMLLSGVMADGDGKAIVTDKKLNDLGMKRDKDDIILLPESQSDEPEKNFFDENTKNSETKPEQNNDNMKNKSKLSNTKEEREKIEVKEIEEIKEIEENNKEENKDIKNIKESKKEKQSKKEEKQDNKIKITKIN